MRGEAPVEGEEPNERVPNSRGSSRGSQSSRERERRRGGTSSRERPRSDGRGASASKSAAEGGSGGGEAAPSSSTRRPISLTQTPGPTPLDEYDVIKAIGKGKFAIVYRARHRATGTFVAIKLVKTADMPEKKRNKCLKEVRLLASLDHSNIIRCFQSFVLDSNLFLVLEWAEAGDLKRQIRKANERNSRFHERLIWSYFSQLADAVAHMHEHRIMHRDLKPANIFLTAQAKVKVGDLGLGRHFSEKTEHVFSKVGTPLYMSPEVLQGGGYDWKSDVWSLGCILYELAVLKSPFKEPGLKLYGLFKKITRGVFDPVPDHYSPVLREMTSRMIDINVARRPTTAQVAAAARHMLLVSSGEAPMPTEALLPSPIEDDTMKEEPDRDSPLPDDSSQSALKRAAEAAEKELSNDDSDATAESAGTAESERSPEACREAGGERVRSRSSRRGDNVSKAESGASAPPSQQQQQQRIREQPTARTRAQSVAAAPRRTRDRDRDRDRGRDRGEAPAPRRERDEAAARGKRRASVGGTPAATFDERAGGTAGAMGEKGPQHGRARASTMPANSEVAQREIADRRRRSIDFSFVLMEDVFHKLQVLGFENVPHPPSSAAMASSTSPSSRSSLALRRPFTRVHFALPFQEARALPRGGEASESNPYAAALGGGPASDPRFDEFCALCSTLLDELGHVFDAEEHGGAMAAVRTSTALLIVLQKCGVSQSHTAQLPPHTLARGYGPTVVWVLHFLVDECLRRRDVADEDDATSSMRRPWGELRRFARRQRGGNLDADEDDDEVIEDAVGDGGGGNQRSQFDASGWTHSRSAARRGRDLDGGDGGERGGGASDEWESESGEGGKDGAEVADGALLPLITPTVGSAVWLAEAQKLEPVLRKAERAAWGRSAAEWRGRVETCSAEAAAIAAALPATLRDVGRVGRELDAAVESVRRGEEALQERVSASGDAESGSEMASLRRRADESSALLADLKSARAAEEEELRALEEEVLEVQRAAEERQAAVTDEAPLHRIKAALVQLGEENEAMELRIGLSSVALSEASRLQRLRMRRGEGCGAVEGDGSVVEDEDEKNEDDDSDGDDVSDSWQ